MVYFGLSLDMGLLVMTVVPGLIPLPEVAQ